MAQLPPREERDQIVHALLNWFESQGISAEVAAFTMATLLGYLLNAIFEHDPKLRQDGLKCLIGEMMQASNE